MWLLDANLDVHLVSLFAELGIKCESATTRGWGGLSNGDLVGAASQAGFTCILTRDKLFAESARQSLQVVNRVSLVVVQLPQKPWREYVAQFRRAWVDEPIKPAPGEIVFWPEAEQ